MIVGFHGRMRSGKDTACERLRVLSSLPVVRVSFAARLKESSAALLDLPVDLLEAYKNDPEAVITVTLGGRVVRTMTVREFWQRYGTEAHRYVFGPDFWVDAALPFHWDQTRPQYHEALFVVTDVRFENEAQRVKDLGGSVVLISGVDLDTGSHASESELPPELIDIRIENSVRDDGFRWLDAQLTRLLEVLGG